ncbi:PaaI family thioesterase [Variovorax paradoxus]|nr:PaaI family thioesterase [Variovorax paradoxus]MBT2302512.1 PaaI family thioesterase [Variovorax paradoxus]
MTNPGSLGWAPQDSVDPFGDVVGPLWARQVDETTEYALLASSKHLSRFGRVHGAVLMWLADKAMSLTAWNATGRPAQIATVQLDVQFADTVHEGSLVEARCEVVRKTRSIVFVTGLLSCGSGNVAAASGVWKYR